MAKGGTISDIVKDVVGRSLAEDADDLAAIEGRKDEPVRPFEAFVMDLTRRRVRPPLRRLRRR